MLRPYPLEPPPPLPPIDGAWEGPEAPDTPGRRARFEEGGVAFGGGARVRGMQVLSGQGRWLVAREDPCLVWEIHGDGPVRGNLELLLGEAEIHVERSADGATFWFGGGAGAELLVGVTGGRGTVTGSADGARLQVEGEGLLRVLVVGAADEADRARVLRAIARKGLAGLQAQWRQRATQLDGLRLRLDTPEPSRDAALRALLDREESAVIELPGGRLVLAEPLDGGAAMLALGIREPVRDVLRGPFDDPRLLELFALYAHWAGVDEFVQKQWPRVLAALTTVAPSRTAALLPVAEAVGDGHRFAALGGRATDEGTPRVPVPPALQELWGLRPEGLEGACTVAPALPAGWREMALHRLRVGATTLDLRMVRRPAGVAVKCRRSHGPALVLHLAPRLDYAPTGVLVDDQQLGTGTVSLAVAEEVEALWLT